MTQTEKNNLFWKVQAQANIARRNLNELENICGELGLDSDDWNHELTLNSGLAAVNEYQSQLAAYINGIEAEADTVTEPTVDEQTAMLREAVRTYNKVLQGFIRLEELAREAGVRFTENDAVLYSIELHDDTTDPDAVDGSIREQLITRGGNSAASLYNRIVARLTPPDENEQTRPELTEQERAEMRIRYWTVMNHDRVTSALNKLNELAGEVGVVFTETDAVSQNIELPEDNPNAEDIDSAIRDELLSRGQNVVELFCSKIEDSLDYR